jgi:Flp pilus assembly pilin Flp
VTGQQDRGASALEYGLMIAAIAGALVAVVFSLGSVLHDSLEDDSACFQNQLNSRPC